MYSKRIEIQKQNDSLRATPKRVRSKVNQIVTPELQKPVFEKLFVKAPPPSPELLLTPEYSKYPSAIRASLSQAQLPAIYYPQQIQQEQTQLTYFNKPSTPKPGTKAEIKVTGNIVLISATNNEIISFNKKLMIGYQVSIAEEKLSILLKSNNLSVQMLNVDDWAEVIDTLHLIITNKSQNKSQSNQNPPQPSLLSKLAKCFQKREHVTSASQTEQHQAVSP
jgi:hypothetical protein